MIISDIFVEKMNPNHLQGSNQIYPTLTWSSSLGPIWKYLRFYLDIECHLTFVSIKLKSFSYQCQRLFSGFRYTCILTDLEVMRMRKVWVSRWKHGICGAQLCVPGRADWPPGVVAPGSKLKVELKSDFTKLPQGAACSSERRLVSVRTRKPGLSRSSPE